MRRYHAILTCLFLLPATCFAGVIEDEASSRAQVQAAVSTARSALKRQINREPVGTSGEWTVESFLAKIASADDVMDNIAGQASQIGGPRWLDESTCQVRLELPGEVVARTLVQQADDAPDSSPIPAEALRRQLELWDSRTFSATGTSTTAALIAQFARPDDENEPWKNVSSKDRQQAVEQATQNAIARTLDDALDERVNDQVNVRMLLTNAKALESVKAWSNRLPVSRVEFSDDRSVTVTLAVDRQGLAKLIRQLADDGSHAARDWDTMTTCVTSASAFVAGTASASVTEHGIVRDSARLPARPPRWARQTLESVGISTTTASRLRNTSNARQAAMEQLRQQVDALEIAPGVTIGGAARTDPRIAESVDRLIDQARSTRVAYNPDGSISVRASVDLQDLWDELKPRD